jgi:hypothetical protein
MDYACLVEPAELARLRAIEAAAIDYARAKGEADKASVSASQYHRTLESTSTTHHCHPATATQLACLACATYDALVDALPAGCLDEHEPTP